VVNRVSAELLRDRFARSVYIGIIGFPWLSFEMLFDFAETNALGVDLELTSGIARKGSILLG